MFHKEETPMLRRTLSAFAIGSLVSLNVYPQDLPRTQFKVIGLNGPTVASMVDEVPFWRETLPKVSNGAITADVTPLDQMGIDDKTMLRLRRLGVTDSAGLGTSKMAGWIAVSPAACRAIQPAGPRWPSRSTRCRSAGASTWSRSTRRAGTASTSACRASCSSR